MYPETRTFQEMTVIVANGDGYVELACTDNYYLVSLSEESGYDGVQISANAIPQPGARFINWTIYGELYSIEEFIEDFFDASTLVANFSGEASVSPIPSPIPSTTPEPSPIPSIAPTPIPSTAPSPTPALVSAPVVKICLVNFDLNGGKRTGGGELSQLIVKDGWAFAPTTTREGYIFMGWDTAFDKVTSDLFVKAVWDKILNTFTVTFDPNGGIKSGGGDLIQKVKEGTAAIAPIVTHDGYKFEDWDGAFDNVTKDITIKAKWVEKDVVILPEEETYTIIYDANSGTGDVPVDSNDYYEGDTAVLEDGNGLSKEGYQFEGWSFIPDGEVATSEEIIISEDVTLYAFWSIVPVPEEESDTVIEKLPKTGGDFTIYFGILMLLSGVALFFVELIHKKKMIDK